jgi:poly-beta-1,6-N-acetyl-D-glucosamine synthase
MSNFCLLSAMALLSCAAMIVFLTIGISVGKRQNRMDAQLPLVTVIVAVRDGEHTISACLQSIAAQNYPCQLLEIIVVDDHSKDDTLRSLQAMQKSIGFRLLRHLTSSGFKSSKKAALELAIAQANGEILLFTDADCEPPLQWVRKMVFCFTPQVGLVAGFSPQTSAHLWWNGFLLCDSAAAAFVAAGTIGWGKGVTCTGRNLAYRKQAFEDVGGFSALPDSLSGDDDFMLQRITAHPKWQVRYALDAETVVPAQGPQKLSLFLRQKQRHLSAGRSYSLIGQLGYAIYHGANIILWLSAALGIFSATICFAPLLVKITIDGAALLWFMGMLNIRLKWRHIIAWAPLFLFYHVFSTVSAAIKKTSWE